MNIGFISLGCAKNQVDTEIMIGILKKNGHRIVDSIEKAELVVINTCGFINEAKEEAINTIISTGKLKEVGELKYIIATGCLSQRYGKELLDEMPELDGVVGVSSFTDINIAVQSVCQGERIAFLKEPEYVFGNNGPRVLTTPPGSAYLKIADGCDNRCSYCTIPSIRGDLRSKPLEQVEKEAFDLVINKNIKELVLIAQDTTVYGEDIYGKKCLPELLKKLCLIPDLKWIRLMYLHPAHIDEKLIEVIASEAKVIPYLDIPIQHASDKILKSMNRKHDRILLNELINKLRKNIDNLVLRTTVMVGFPGESNDDFNELLDFVVHNEFDWLGAFSFVPEEGTVAYKLSNQVPDDIKMERKEQILTLQKKITRDKNIKRINNIEPILVSGRISKNLYIGRGYFQAPEVDGITMVKSNGNIGRGEIINVKLEGVRNYDMIGEIC